MAVLANNGFPRDKYGYKSHTYLLRGMLCLYRHMGIQIYFKILLCNGKLALSSLCHAVN